MAAVAARALPASPPTGEGLDGRLIALCGGVAPKMGGVRGRDIACGEAETYFAERPPYPWRYGGLLTGVQPGDSTWLAFRRPLHGVPVTWGGATTEWMKINAADFPGADLEVVGQQHEREFLQQFKAADEEYGGSTICRPLKPRKKPPQVALRRRKVKSSLSPP